MTNVATPAVEVGVPTAPIPVPTKAELQAVIPAHCFQRKLSTSLRYAAFSVAATVIPGILAWLYLPLSLAWLPVWLLYSLVAGTAACGVWVVAHECGHDAFCDNRAVQDGIGFVLHSLLLVPYFSWQRSHAIHHAKTNHVTDGETHVPKRAESEAGRRALATRRGLGVTIHAGSAIVARLLFGWPLYLLTGATGGPDRGVTNHFWPTRPFSRALFPSRWASKVVLSAVGVLGVVGLLIASALATGSVVPVVALYVGPYLVCNAWLVAYTWLHHTSADTPHYDDPQWSFVRGAFCSIDRPYGRLLDLVHHHIGSTHVAHHLFARIPHYHAVEATEAIKAAYPELYRYDPTPIPKALWQVSKHCVAVSPTDDGWRYTSF
ncbi:MAG: fatty acid desaturase [Acidimicrobiales bacterium]